MVSTTVGFTSTPVTCNPRLAATAAVGSPMYPSPKNKVFIVRMMDLFLAKVRKIRSWMDFRE